MAKTVLISVTSDLATDQRVHRTATVFKETGHNVLVIGRKLHSSGELNSRRYRVVRLRLLFEKGPLFYALFNLKLFWLLLQSKADIYFSNDLDTLLPNYLVSKIKNKPLVYDSHEYFTGVPELQNRLFVKRIWKKIEKSIVPHLKNTITVNDSIAGLYKEEYGVQFTVIRNMPMVPLEQIAEKEQLRRQLSLPLDQKIIILQGAGINIQRGAEEAVEAMQHLENTLLLVVGGGDVIPELKRYVQQHQLDQKVRFVPKQSAADLRLYTSAADLGLSLDKDTNINYRFSLPNKIFDYIQSGIPVLASNLPEVRKVIEDYKVGCITDSHDPRQLAVLINKMLTDPALQAMFKEHLPVAAKTLNWDREKDKLVNLIQHLDW